METTAMKVHLQYFVRAMFGCLLGCSLACQQSAKPTDASPREQKNVVRKAPEGGQFPAVAEDPSPGDGEIGLLAWIDPDAVGVSYRVGGSESLVANFDADALITLFGLPPRAEQILRDQQAILDGLEMLLEVDHSELGTWLSGELLAMLPVMARGTYLVVETKKPASEVAAKLTAAGMHAHDVEGIQVLDPTGSFAWRAVILDDHTIAFVPTSEVGSGLGPLTAARDLPPSEIEQQLVQLQQQDPLMLTELFVQGPMMHIDLDDPVGVVRFTLRRWQSTGIEGIVMMQPLGDSSVAAKSLEGRDNSLETEQMKSLMQRVAFVAEGPVVQGRLQMPAEDLRHLTRFDR